MASKTNQSSIQRQICTTIVVEVIKDSPPLPQVEDNLVLVTSHSNPSQQDLVPSSVGQGLFQTILFFRSTQKIHQGDPSHIPLTLPVILGQEMLPDLQLLQANLGMQ